MTFIDQDRRLREEARPKCSFARCDNLAVEYSEIGFCKKHHKETGGKVPESRCKDTIDMFGGGS